MAKKQTRGGGVTPTSADSDEDEIETSESEASDNSEEESDGERGQIPKLRHLTQTFIILDKPTYHGNM